MSRNKPPTTMSPPFLVRETLHRVEDNNLVIRRVRAARLLADFVASRPDQRMIVAEKVAQTGDAFVVARELGLIEDPVVTQRRRLRSTRRR